MGKKDKKKKMGFFRKLFLSVIGLAILVGVGGAVAAQVTGNPDL